MSQLVDNVMTRDNLVTAREGVTLEEAKEILRRHKIEKLPIVDDENHLKGLITIKDIEKAVKYPLSARDKDGRLLCAAAIGATSDVLDRAAALVEAQVDALVPLANMFGYATDLRSSTQAAASTPWSPTAMWRSPRASRTRSLPSAAAARSKEIRAAPELENRLAFMGGIG